MEMSRDEVVRQAKEDGIAIDVQKAFMKVLNGWRDQGVPFETAAKILNLNENERELYAAIYADVQNQ